MVRRIEACDLQYIEKIVPFLKCSFHQVIDVSFHQLIRMFVIRAKHQQILVIPDQRDEFFKIFGRSEERRVGKESRCRGGTDKYKAEVYRKSMRRESTGRL